MAPGAVIEDSNLSVWSQNANKGQSRRTGALVWFPVIDDSDTGRTGVPFTAVALLKFEVRIQILSLKAAILVQTVWKVPFEESGRFPWSKRISPFQLSASGKRSCIALQVIKSSLLEAKHPSGSEWNLIFLRSVQWYFKQMYAWKKLIHLWKG